MVENEVNFLDAQTRYMAAEIAKCNVDTFANMHKQKLGSNSPRASRTEPGK